MGGLGRLTKRTEAAQAENGSPRPLFCKKAFLGKICRHLERRRATPPPPPRTFTPQPSSCTPTHPPPGSPHSFIFIYIPGSSRFMNRRQAAGSVPGASGPVPARAAAPTPRAAGEDKRRDGPSYIPCKNEEWLSSSEERRRWWRWRRRRRRQPDRKPQWSRKHLKLKAQPPTRGGRKAASSGSSSGERQGPLLADAGNEASPPRPLSLSLSLSLITPFTPCGVAAG